MRISTEKVTPSYANKILNNDNNKNRNLRQTLVDFYALQMERGHWQTNGEAIKIGKNDILIDGQHRLAAIVKYGKAVEMVVIRGIDPRVMPTIDIGKSRTVSDHLKISGMMGNTTLIASTVRVIACFFAGKGSFVENKGVRRMSPSDTIAFVERHRGIGDAVERVEGFSGLKGLLPPTVSAACYFLFSQIDGMKTAAFFTQLSSGEGLKKGDPILVLRGQLIGIRGETKKNRFNQRFFLYYMCKAFEYFLEGREAQQAFKFNANTMSIDLPKKPKGK